MKFYKSHGISLGVFIISLIITWIVWQYTRHTVRLKEEALFLQEVQEVKDVIKYRLDDYIESLFGLRSLFATEEEMTWQKWGIYCGSLDLRSRVPGIVSLRFDVHITVMELSAFIQKMRADTTLFLREFPMFSIFSAPNLKSKQPPQQDDLYVVTYIWPWNGSTELYGLNMFSIPERRRVIEQARDSGKPAVSSKITSSLDQGDQIPGFAVYLPVYRYGAPIDTVQNRRAAIQGVVAVRFNAYELIEDTLHRVRRHPRIDVEIFDGTVLKPEHLYYNDDDVLQAQNSHSMPMYSKKVTLDMYGQPWTLFFSSKPGFHLETTEVFFPWIALGTGIIISLLLTGTIFSLTTSQIRATQIAERMTKELERQRAVAMRSDRLRSLGEMAAGIAHELNQPLVGVRGLAEHILIAQDRRWNMNASTIREKVATIVEQADRMSHIIEHVRIFAREAGKPELRPVNVNEVVESSTNLLGAQFSSHGLTLEKSLAMDLPPVLANPFTLEEVVLNLLLNARDAVEERLQSEPDMQTPGVFLRTQAFMENGHSMVRIEVRDNGIGIPQEIQGKIFDPFFTTKAPDKGTGLGLSISKTILEEFRGTLTMTCTPEKGTTAVITLPAEEKYGTST